MTAPQPQGPDGMTAQILVEIGKLSTQLAVMAEQLKAVPDHENRLRALEGAIPPRLEDRLNSLETARAKLIGVAAAVSLAASAGGTWVGLVIAHHH